MAIVVNKAEVIRCAIAQLDARLSILKKSIAEIQQAANEETKSTAGDKYETGRAMAHLEIEKLQMQLNDLNRGRQVLAKINSDLQHQSIQLGSLVETSRGNFLIAASLGEVISNGSSIVQISLASPLGAKLLGKTKGETVSVNSATFKITRIF